MKKFLALALASVMAVSLVACGSTNADTNAESSAAATTTATTAESSSEEPGLKIAIVSSPSGVDDGSFNQDNYNGVLKFIEENPNATVTPIREETGDSAAAVQAVADVVADYDVIVCCGFQFAGIGNLAQENPDTKFILVDSFPTDADGNTIEADNIYAMCYAEQESAFCLIDIFDTTFKTILVIYVGRICDSVYNCNFVGLCLKCCCHTSTEGAFLLRIDRKSVV